MLNIYKKEHHSQMMEIRPISKELRKVAIEELNENPEKTEDYIRYFRDWLNKQPHLNARSDDQSLVTFLRGCKWNIPRAKEKIDYFYTIRTSMPEFFLNRDPLDSFLQKVLDLGIMCPLRNTGRTNGSRIIWIDMSVMNYKLIKLKDLIKLFFILTDVLMVEDDNFVINGETILVNCANIPWNFYLQLTPSILRKFVICWQNAYPLRIKGFIAINTTTILANIYSILVKPFLSKKLQNRFHLFSAENSYKAYHYIPKSLFPKKFGGENGTYLEMKEHTKCMVEHYRDWFLDDAIYLTNEMLRPCNSKVNEKERENNMFPDDLGID